MKGREDGWRLDESSEVARLVPTGIWRLATVPRISERGLPRRAGGAIVADGGELRELDTCGAMHLLECLAALSDGREFKLENFRAEHSQLTELVKERLPRLQGLKIARPSGILSNIGQGGVSFLANLRDMASFVGRLAFSVAEYIRSPRLFRFKELVVQLETVLWNALPVVGLVTFLIGVVVAYLYASQAEKYGANIFIVDGIGLAMCRELSPIIAAIIMAGRSGSAYTAQLGTMKINEEIDAITTLGLSPMHVLVVPRILALMLAMPFLVFLGDVVGIGGGMIIAQVFLDVTPHTFLERLQVVLLLKHVFVGLVKAPVFALFIAMVACRLGLGVENNARSVGLNTTATVVQAIVSVIILNAIFAIVLTELKI